MSCAIAVVLLLSNSVAHADHGVCDVQGTSSGEGGECLLQASVGSVGSVDSMVSAAGVSAHQYHSKVSAKDLEEPQDPISLGELGAEQGARRSESRLLGEMLRTSESRCRSYRAHAMFLQRHTDAMKASQKAVNVTMDKLIQKFIDNQAGSQDAAHSQLLEARQQLNQLHDVVSDLANQVNATETIIAVTDKELQGKLKDLQDLDKDRSEKLAACKAKKDADTEKFKKLSEEMEEMAEIASPTVTMDVKDGTIHKVSLVQEHNHLVASVPDPDADANAFGGKTNQPDEADVMHANVDADAMSHMKESVTEASSDLPQLIQATKNAAAQFLTCMKHPSSGQTSLLQQRPSTASPAANSDEAANEGSEATTKAPSTSAAPAKDDNADDSSVNDDSAKEADNLSNNNADNNAGDFPANDNKADEPTPAKPKSDAECKAEKEKLEKTYVKAYVELARLKSEYDALANSTACVDAVEAEYNDRKVPLQDASDKLASLIAKKVQDLQGLRPRLAQAKAAEKNLRKYVDTMVTQVAELEPAISDLNVVRDAIRALSACPGLSRVQFSVPKWTGSWVSFNQNAKGQSDADQDAAMNAACDAASKGSRAAGVGEIAEKIVEGMPDTNTAPEPLLGACPMCEGDNDASYVSGHARTCWAQGEALTLQDKDTFCSDGAKSILCVIDRSNLKEAPGGVSASLLLVSPEANTETPEETQSGDE